MEEEDVFLTYLVMKYNHMLDVYNLLYGPMSHFLTLVDYKEEDTRLTCLVMKYGYRFD